MENIKYSKQQQIACFALVCMPLLQCYNFLGTALTKFLMLGLVAYFAFIVRTRPTVPTKLKFFLLYAFTVPQVFAIISGYTSEFLGSFITLGLYFATFIFFIPHLDLSLIRKYYRVTIYISIGVFLLQEISYYATGARFGVLIPFLDLYNGTPASDYLPMYSSFNRSCSIFVEPSHFAQYLAPYLALSLNEVSHKKRFFDLETIVISLVFIFLRSGNGYFLLASIWIVQFLCCNMSVLKKLCIILPFAAIIIFYGFTYFSNSEMGEQVLSRTEQLDPNYSGDSQSGTIRIFRGFWVYSSMPTILKFFGVGLGGVNGVIDNSPLSWSFVNEHYVNNVSCFLMAFGYIGVFLLVLFLISLCSKNEPGSIALIAAFICLGLMESFLFDSRMLLYLLLPYSMVYCNRKINYRI